MGTENHIPGICSLPFHPLPAVASSAASCQPGTLDSLPPGLGPTAITSVIISSIIKTAEDDHKHNSNLHIPLHLPYLW